MSRLDSSGSRQGYVAGYSEHVIENSGSTNCGNFLLDENIKSS